MDLRGSPYPDSSRGRVLSAWNWRDMAYDVYVDPSGSPDVGGWDWRPPAASVPPVSPIGAPIEAFLRELPPTARFVGKSKDAMGEVVVKNRQAALWSQTNVPRGAGISVSGPDSPPDPKWLLWAGLGLFVLVGWQRIRSALRG